MRQLWPLVVMLLLVAAFIYIIFIFNRTLHGLTDTIALGLPGFFAVGAGALLVGQEKELRTLQWLTTLPVSKSRLILTKVWVALAGLLFMWMAGLLVIAFNQYMGVQQNVLNSAVGPVLTSLLTMPIHTLFLLLAGFSLAWKFQTPIKSLIALIPTAFVPLVLAHLFDYVIAKFSSTRNAGSDLLVVSSAALITAQVISCTFVCWWGWRNALIALGPATTTMDRSQAVSNEKTLTLGAPQPQVPALIWQVAKQNQWLLLVGLGLVTTAITIGLFVLTATRNSSASAMVPAGLLILVAASTLGASTFQFDRVNRRQRFLSDRGISPKLIWLTRHIPAISILALPILTTFVLGSGILPTPLRDSWNPEWLLGSVIVIAGIGLGILTVYSVSQWVGQVLSSPIISTIAAFVVSAAALTYLFTMVEMGVPLWVIIPILVLPLVTTLALTKHWLDERYDWFYWSTHTITLLLFVILPLLPLGLAWYRTRQVIASTRSLFQPILSSSDQSRSLTCRPLDLTIIESTTFQQSLDPSEHSAGDSDESARSDQSPISEQSPGLVEAGAEGVVDRYGSIDSFPKELTFAEQILRTLAGFESQVAISTVPISIRFDVLNLLQTDLALLRSRYQARQAKLEGRTTNETDGTEKTELLELSDFYNRMIQFIAKIIPNARRNLDLKNQEMVDRLELILLNELQQAKETSLVSDIAWNQATQVLANQQFRDESRRYALAHSWRYSMQPGGLQGLSNASLDPPRDTGNYVKLLEAQEQGSHIAVTLWQLLDTNSADTAELRSKLARLTDNPEFYYGIGPKGIYCRADDLREFIFETHITFRNAPGAQWHAAWEKQAAELAKSGKP